MKAPKDEEAARAWRRLRALAIGVCVTFAAIDAVKAWYGWTAAWLGLGAVNVWLDQAGKKNDRHPRD